MNEIERLLDQFRRAYSGDTWSGPSLTDTLQGLTAAEAASRPIPPAHSIWELTLHLTAWIDIVRRRVEENNLLELTDAQDWPVVPASANEAEWQQAQANLGQAHEKLLALVAQLQHRDLDRQLGTARDRSQGSGITHYVLLHGLVQHNLYHAGQIALLRKAFS